MCLLSPKSSGRRFKKCAEVNEVHGFGKRLRQGSLSRKLLDSFDGGERFARAFRNNVAEHAFEILRTQEVDGRS